MSLPSSACEASCYQEVLCFTPSHSVLPAWACSRYRDFACQHRVTSCASNTRCSLQIYMKGSNRLPLRSQLTFKPV